MKTNDSFLCGQNVIMPPRSERSAVVVIKPEELILACEWQECSFTFRCMETFTDHVNSHLQDFFNSLQSQSQSTGRQHSSCDIFTEHCFNFTMANVRCYHFIKRPFWQYLTLMHYEVIFWLLTLSLC